MLDRTHLVRFEGQAFRCAPDNGPFRLGSLIDLDGENDRWHRPGEPTVYLALDAGVAVSEAGRHLEPDGQAQCQRIFRLAVNAADIADLTDPIVLQHLRLAAQPTWFLDRDRARRVASRLRREGPARGLLVPSAAFVDDPSRANLVLFMDGREDRIGELIHAHVDIGEIRLGGG